MLQKEAVVPEVITMIKELQNDSLFKDHLLAGGTALTLQLGHRTSTDVDLFTQKPQNTSKLLDYFRKNYNDLMIDYANNDYIRIYVNGIKVEMVHYEEKIYEKNLVNKKQKYKRQ